MFQSKGNVSERNSPCWDVKDVLSWSSSDISSCQYALLASSVENIVTDPQRVDTFVHAWWQAWILDCHCVPIPVTYAKAGRCGLLRDEIDRWRPLLLRGIEKVHCEHSIHFLDFNFSPFPPCIVWGWLNLSFILLFQIDWVLHSLYRTKVSVSHDSELLKIADKVFGICALIAWQVRILAPVSLQNYVWLFSGIMKIHLLGVALRWLISNSINSGTGINFVILRRFWAFFFQHEQLVISCMYAACWGTLGISDYHKLRQANLLSRHIWDIELKRLSS